MGILVWFAATESALMEQTQAMNMAGKVVSFTLLLNLLFRPLRVIADKFNVLQMGMVAGERILLVLDNQDVLPSQPNARKVLLKGEVRFENVGFSFTHWFETLEKLKFLSFLKK